MPLIVQKFGGTSVATVAHIRKAADVVARCHADGNEVVVVVSAMGDATNQLVDLAREIAGRPTPREMDMLLSSGEQISISLMAMALQEKGLDARSYLGHQVGIRTDGVFSTAQIREVKTERLKADLAANHIPVVAGFQGSDETGEVTTLVAAVPIPRRWRSLRRWRRMSVRS